VYWLCGRALRALLCLFGVLGLIFLLLHTLPGDTVTSLVGPDTGVSAARREELRRLFGLDAPLRIQLLRWVTALLHGDLGVSLRTGRRVAEDLFLRLPITAELSIFGLLLSIGVALPLGLWAAARPGRVLDRTLEFLSLLGMSLPSFFLGLLLLLGFSLHLPWLPPAGYVPPVDLKEHLRHLLLPTVTLAVLLGSELWRRTRAALREVLPCDFIRTARAKGLAEWVVYGRHALRASALPLVTAVALQLGSLLGGVVVIETVFGLPGLGRLLVEGVSLRDYPVVQGATLLTAGLLLGVNLLLDALCVVLDPRLRHGGGG
jgi:peptide/nickel transport system permease protein